MTVRIYGELYDIGIEFFDDVEILSVKEFTSSVFIDYIKGGNYKDNPITMSMSKSDYISIQRHIKIKSLGI